jgi:hypothetical protein
VNEFTYIPLTDSWYHIPTESYIHSGWAHSIESSVLKLYLSALCGKMPSDDLLKMIGGR